MTELKRISIPATVIDKYQNKRVISGREATEHILVLRAWLFPPVLAVSTEPCSLHIGDKTELIMHLLPDGEYHPSKTYAELLWKREEAE
ncbi:MAG: hypothetical protein WC878_04345 [Candidatus Paceibacterota bacterium]|jgi:hypothetical protein